MQDFDKEDHVRDLAFAEEALTVKLIDTCSGGKGRVIDLYHGAFKALARKAGLSTSRGGLTVTVRW